MNYVGNKVENIKIAYIGGGSQGWAWKFMSDLASVDDISGNVDLYDIDLEAAKKNETIGNKFKDAEGAKSVWSYRAVADIKDALQYADFVLISILPGTMKEMASDVHVPEKYGIYQSVGDTTGPGGIIRAMRTLPMYEYIGQKIKEICPDAWVISYTNPMSLCVKTLYGVFPEIKAFGCCHEVFGTQAFLCDVVKEKLGIADIERHEINVNPVSVNHFTWLTEATYKNHDLLPYYAEFCEEHKNGYQRELPWEEVSKDNMGANEEMVKMDLFRRYNCIAAAGDRHLAEFCEGKWYLENPQRVEDMHFRLTPVTWRVDLYKEKYDYCQKLLSGEENVVIEPSGEEGVNQLRALLGLSELVTNVNLPNRGQIPNLPMGAIVETNAVFRGGCLRPVLAGDIPKTIYPMVSRVCAQQELIYEGISQRDLKKIFAAFANDPLTTCSYEDSKKLFKEMCENTKEYLTMYDLDSLE